MNSKSSDNNAANQGDLARYHRQIVFEQIGLDGQRKLSAGRVLIIGVGGLGSWAAELLTRAGVGMVRLVDSDVVDLSNLHRQALYSETDATEKPPKVTAAAAHLRQINSDVCVEPVLARVDADNIESIVGDVDLILDGTDNFATRFLINDVAIKLSLPWIFTGAVGTEAQIMTIVPGQTPCLRCVLDTPPPPCRDLNCSSFGVIGPIVAAVASFQAAEAIKILTGQLDAISPYLTKFDLWTNQMNRINVTVSAADTPCPCCKEREFEFLEP